MTKRDRGMVVDVQPLASFGQRALGESSKSSRSDDTAIASERLWHDLCPNANRHVNDDDKGAKMYVAVECFEERRLSKKGKARNLIVQVRKNEDDVRDNGDDKTLHVPLQLLPRFFNIPLRATVHRHRPVRLSTAILQPIAVHDTSEPLDTTDLDLSPLMRRSESRAPNGHFDDDRSQERPETIWREGHNVTIWDKTSQRHRPFRIAMLEPAAQGYIDHETKVIVSSTPFVFGEDEDEDDDHVDGIIDGLSSHGKTHISLADFDPDAFLSSSLDLALRAQPSNGFDIDRDMAHSISSTSGSVTPRPPGTRMPAPPSPPARPDELVDGEEDELDGTRLSAVRAMGPTGSEPGEEVCWMSVSSLGRAGVFEGDWVLLRPVSGNASLGRLTKVLAWERLDEDIDDLPSNPILIPPVLFHSLFPLANSTSSTEIILSPTPFGARLPSLPVARSVTISRIATTQGVDKRYERSWLKGLKQHLAITHSQSCSSDDKSRQHLMRRGDIFAVPVSKGAPISPESENEGSSDDEEDIDYASRGRPLPTELVYFKVTTLNYEPLMDLEADFRSSVSSKGRAGELGCWVDIGDEGMTQLVLEGLERERVTGRDASKAWHGVGRHPVPYDLKATGRLRDLLLSCISRSSFASTVQLSILVKGARGSGKKALIAWVADEVGLNVVQVDCYDAVGESQTVTEGILMAQLAKATSASPSILLLDHIEALAKRSESSATGRAPAIVKIIEDVMEQARVGATMNGWPVIVIGTTVDEDSVPGELLAMFKQDITLPAPDESARLSIVLEAFGQYQLGQDVRPKSIASQTAALQAGDIRSMAHRAYNLALQRVQNSSQSLGDVLQAGISITSADITTTLNDARSSYSDSIGAPKIPNVSWDDIGGLRSVKDDILDTIQLPLQHPELFAQGLKKRSGILLYGPPGTGKTLLAKAVATSCSLNFFSVKGPELLNMYIGESEANVRRVFQRARDASPCVVFMDELDSVAPKRGNQGDSGGVMDRIVSQLLAELDGMSSGGNDTQVYVLGATNRPDLLDPALLRPGRFDRMLYLSVATTHSEQLSILKALTRKFKLEPKLDLEEISEMCPFNYTGADFYALCSDAMLKAMTRAADNVDRKVEQLNRDPVSTTHVFPRPLTVQYYLATMATPDDIDVKVGREDFVDALRAMKPSVSESEMKHYERVQQEFKGFNIGETEA